MKKNGLNAASCILVVLISTAGTFLARCDSPSGSEPIDWSYLPDVDSEGRVFSALLDGETGVPPVETTATGELEIPCARFGELEWVISCKFFVANMKQEDVIGFDIHQGQRGDNGKVLAFLNKAPSVIFSYYEGRLYIYAQLDGSKSDGFNQITAKQLIEEMGKWNTYADIRTKDHPNGEIRGQIKPS